jgi:hypothetical protein
MMFYLYRFRDLCRGRVARVLVSPLEVMFYATGCTALERGDVAAFLSFNLTRGAPYMLSAAFVLAVFKGEVGQVDYRSHPLPWPLLWMVQFGMLLNGFLGLEEEEDLMLSPTLRFVLGCLSCMVVWRLPTIMKGKAPELLRPVVRIGYFAWASVTVLSVPVISIPAKLVCLTLTCAHLLSTTRM